MKTRKKTKKKEKKKAMNNAERQKKYRDNASKNNLYKINTVISGDIYFCLDRIARRYGITKRKVIENLLDKENNRIVKKLETDTPEWNEYFNI